MNFRILLPVLSLLIQAPSFAVDIPPEIAALCKDRWGSDYQMQLHCRQEQMEALQQLKEDDEMIYREEIDESLSGASDAYVNGGGRALVLYTKSCYASIVSVADYQGCASVDYFGAFVTEDAFFAADVTAQRSVKAANSVGVNVMTNTGSFGGIASIWANALK